MQVSSNAKTNDSLRAGTARAPARRWRWAAFYALVLIISGAGLFLAASTGYLTRPVTAWLSTQLGRTLVADGGLRIEFGRVTRLTAAGLRLANVSWGGRADMLLARNVELEIDTGSLFRDTVIVHRVAVDGLDLQLESNARGQNNWSFDLHRKGSSGALPLVIEYAALPRAKIRFSGARLEHPLDIELDALEHRGPADGLLELKAHGQANATRLDLHLTVGPFANLVASRDFKVKAEGHLGDIALDIIARVDSLAAPADTEATLNLKAPDAAYLASRLGIRDLGTGLVALNITLAPAAAGGGLEGSLSGQIGEFEVTAHGTFFERTDTHEFAVQTRLSGPDLSRMGGITGFNGLPAEPFRMQLDVQRKGDSVRIQHADLELPDGRLRLTGYLGPAGGLAGSELAFSAKVPDVAKIQNRLGIVTVMSGPFEATGVLHHSKPGESKLQFNGTTSLGTFSLSGPITAAPDYYGTRMEVEASGPEFAPLGRVLKLVDSPSGPFKIKGNVEWARAGIGLRGASLAVGGETLTVDGTLGPPPFARHADFRFALSGGNATRLAQRFGIAGFPATGYRVAGRVQRQKDRLVLHDLKATVAGAVLELSGTLGEAPKYLETALAFSVGGSSIESFSALVPDFAVPRGSFQAAGTLTITDNKLRLNKIQAQVAQAQGTFSAEFALPLDSAAVQFTLDAKVPDLTQLLPGLGGAAAVGKNLDISARGTRSGDQWSFERLRISGDDGLISTQGTLIVAPGFLAKDVQVELRAASLRKVGLPTGHQWPDQPLELRARFSRTKQDVTLEELTGQLGVSDFAGRIAVHGPDDKPDLDLRLDVKRLDLDTFLGKSTPAPTPGSALASSQQTRASKRLIIPAEELHLPDLNAFTGKLALRAQNVRLRDQNFSDLQIQATLREGRLHVDPLEMTGTGGQVNARVDLVAKGTGLAAQVSGTAKNLRLTPIPISLGGPNSSSYTAQVDLQGSGSNLRELASTLNGRLRLIGTGGRVANSSLMAGSNGFFKQLVVSLNPMATRQPTTEVVCVAYLLKARDGVLTTDPALVMRTAQVDIISNGSADLRTERIDLSFKTSARKGLGFGVAQLVNPYIKVTGTLGSPGVTLDPTGTLVNGGAAFATAGLSIVATTLWDRVVHEKDPCGAAVAEADRRDAN